MRRNMAGSTSEMSRGPVDDPQRVEPSDLWDHLPPGPAPTWLHQKERLMGRRIWDVGVLGSVTSRAYDQMASTHWEYIVRIRKYGRRDERG